MVNANDISSSEGEDSNGLANEATALIDGGRWQLCNNGKGLERQFKFKTFKATWVGGHVKAFVRAKANENVGLYECCSSGMQKEETPPGMDERL